VIVTASPLVTAYLADLDRALAGADPADRLEIVDAVREHIDAAVTELGAVPAQSEIAGVLRRLGSADDVAAAWAAGAEHPVPPAVAAPWSPPPSGAAAPTTRTGIPGWAILLIVLVALPVVGPLLILVLGPFLFATRVGGISLGFSAMTTLGVSLLLLVAGGTVACAGLWRRSTAHRTAWATAFFTGLGALVLATILGLTARF
jgi:hypothetical protein